MEDGGTPNNAHAPLKRVIIAPCDEEKNSKKQKKRKSKVHVSTRWCKAKNMLRKTWQARGLSPEQILKLNIRHHMDVITSLMIIEQILHLIKAKRPRE